MSARENIIPVFVPHLGCPNNCVFCNQRRISGAQKPADAEDVRSAIENAIRRVPEAERRQLAFYGGSFTAIPAEEQTDLLSAAKEYLDRGIISSVRLSTRPDAIDAAVLRRLKTYGVETVELGAQSLCNEVLRLSGRGHTAEDVVKASRLIRQEGFRLILQMMTGLPGDTRERSLETAGKIIALAPDGVRIYPTVIVRDTALYDLWKSGKYKEHTVEDAVSLCAELLPLFSEAGIPVIRLGLNPTEELSAQGAAGGAYHPALGEMVKSRIMRTQAEVLLQKENCGRRILLQVAPGHTSQMTGQHRCNLQYLAEKFSLDLLKVQESSALNGTEIRVIPVEK